MSPAATQSHTPSTSELVEGVAFYPVALVVASTIFPGFLLCVPGLLFVTVLVLLPLVAVAIVALLAAAVVAAPFLLVRAVRAIPAAVPRTARHLPGFLTGPAAAMRR
jgi:hypothetical protein